MSFSVKGETHNGVTLLIRSGFTSREAAEDHPVVMSRYRRIWVEEVEKVEKPTNPRGKPVAQQDEDAFTAIETAAITGERCPQTHPHGPIGSGCVGRLAHSGKIRSEVFAGNWRRVTICVGPHAGKSTADPPTGTGQPYKVIGPRRLERAS